MNKQGSTKKKISFFAIGARAFIVLGIACIGLALMNILLPQANTIAIQTSSALPQAAHRSPYTGSTVLPSASTDIGQLFEAAVSDIILYPEYPSAGDVVGSLSIPALELELPIIEGTGTDELKAGVGHFIQSVLPGEIDNCVLSGHRDTVFASLGGLKIGDQLIVQTTAGIFTYEVTGTRIVDKDDKTVIVPTDHAVLTLTTCYPFSYIGPAPDRYIVSADLVTGEYPSF